MNILTRMTTINSSVKRAFGNHNMVQRFLEYVRNPDVLMPPFRPVLYRAVACGGPNDMDTILVNENSHHRAKNRLVLGQLVEQYNNYLEIQQEQAIRTRE